jgi:hypothetical protein
MSRHEAEAWWRLIFGNWTREERAALGFPC